MKKLWFVFVIFFLNGKLLPSDRPISYDPAQIYYQDKIYAGVEFVGLCADEVGFLEISKRLNPDILDYATGMIWPQMPVSQRQTLLEDLAVLDEDQISLLALFEGQEMLPETMHPINRIKVVQRVKLLGYRSVSEKLLQIMNLQEMTSKEKESCFARVLMIDDFCLGSNGFLESLLGGLEEMDHPLVIRAFQKSKLSNMRAGLCANLLIDIMMPAVQRIDILEKISEFGDGENAVLLNTNFSKIFLEMPCDEKMCLLKDLSTGSKEFITQKMSHIAYQRDVLRGRSKKKKIILARLPKI